MIITAYVPESRYTDTADDFEHRRARTAFSEPMQATRRISYKLPEPQARTTISEPTRTALPFPDMQDSRDRRTTFPTSARATMSEPIQSTQHIPHMQEFDRRRADLPVPTRSQVAQYTSPEKSFSRYSATHDTQNPIDDVASAHWASNIFTGDKLRSRYRSSQQL